MQHQHRKMYFICILLSAILWYILSYIKIMSVVPSTSTSSASFIGSQVDLKVGARIPTEAVNHPQNEAKDTEKVTVRPPIIRTNNYHNDNLLMMPRCHPPHQYTSSAWRYYNTLVDTNLVTAAKAIKLTDNPTTTQLQQNNNNNNNNNSSSTTKLVGYSKYIPHRLIFTHKQNLFNCSIFSASDDTRTSPDLYTLAENAKATVNAYREVWSDLEVVFLTDQDCLQALNEVEPDLIPFFHREVGACTVVFLSLFFLVLYLFGFVVTAFFHMPLSFIYIFCVSAQSPTRLHIFLSPSLSPSLISGMYKADLCRAAYLYLYGGYYFDVDVLVVRPFFAGDAKFVTVKAWNKDPVLKGRSEGLFQVCMILISIA
jgi:hypothetical protein